MPGSWRRPIRNWCSTTTATRSGTTPWRAVRGIFDPAVSLFPRQQRGVDHVRHALAADRADREIDVLQSEPVGGDLLQREALRCDLFQGELACPVAVAARALHGDE